MVTPRTVMSDIEGRPGRAWPAQERERLAIELLRQPHIASLLQFAASQVGWGTGERRLVAAWKLFFRSPAFQHACDSYEPQTGGFVGHLLRAAEPRQRQEPGDHWSWFDIALATRIGCEDRAIVDRMAAWVTGWSGVSDAQVSWTRRVWTDCWLRRSAAAVRAFDGVGAFFDHAKRWLGDVEHRILGRSGRAWCELERELVVVWLLTNSLKLLVVTALARRVPTDAVDDVIQDFWLTQGFDGLKGVLTNYVPAPGVTHATRFVGFVRVALSHAAERSAVSLHRHAAQEVPADVLEEDRAGIAALAMSAGLEEQILMRESRGALEAAMARCWSKLPQRQRHALLASLRGRAQRETASELGITEDAVKVLTHRGRHRLRQLLLQDHERVGSLDGFPSVPEYR